MFRNQLIVAQFWARTRGRWRVLEGISPGCTVYPHLCYVSVTSFDSIKLSMHLRFWMRPQGFEWGEHNQRSPTERNMPKTTSEAKKATDQPAWVDETDPKSNPPTLREKPKATGQCGSPYCTNFRITECLKTLKTGLGKFVFQNGVRWGVRRSSFSQDRRRATEILHARSEIKINLNTKIKNAEKKRKNNGFFVFRRSKKKTHRPFQQFLQFLR